MNHWIPNPAASRENANPRKGLLCAFAFVLAGCSAIFGEAQAASAIMIGSSPWAPSGASIGMRVSVARAALMAAGYENMADLGGPCFFLTTERTSDGGTVSLQTPSGECTPEQTVTTITYYERVGPRLDLTNLIASYNDKIGQNAACSTLTPSSVDCVWNMPPGLPKIQSIRMMVHGWSYRIDTFAYKTAVNR